MFNRRDFLTNNSKLVVSGIFLSISPSFFFKPSEPRFVYSKCEIDFKSNKESFLNLLSLLEKDSIQGNFLGNILGADQDYQNRHIKIRDQFLSEGKLFQTMRILDRKNYTYTIVNKWRSRLDFDSYNSSMGMKKITQDYEKNNFRISYSVHAELPTFRGIVSSNRLTGESLIFV